MDFEQLKLVDNATRDTVSGYLRDNELNDPPSLIIYCILAFYWLKEYFAILGPGVAVSDDNLTIVKMPKYRYGSGVASFGALIIPSVSNCTYKWKLELTRYIPYPAGRSLLMGVATKWDNHKVHSQHVLGYNAYAGNFKKFKSWTKPAIRCKQGDIVEIELDLKRGQLEFYRNDESVGVAMDNLEASEDIEYRLCVTLNSENDSVTLLSFTTS